MDQSALASCPARAGPLRSDILSPPGRFRQNAVNPISFPARRSRHRYDSGESPWERTEESQSVDCRGGCSLGSRSKISPPTEGNHLRGNGAGNISPGGYVITSEQLRRCRMNRLWTCINGNILPAALAGMLALFLAASACSPNDTPHPTARRKRRPSHAHRGAHGPGAHQAGRLLPGFQR